MRGTGYYLLVFNINLNLMIALYTRLIYLDLNIATEMYMSIFVQVVEYSNATADPTHSLSSQEWNGDLLAYTGHRVTLLNDLWPWSGSTTRRYSVVYIVVYADATGVKLP